MNFEQEQLERTIYVANLIDTITKEDLNNIFLTFGLIKSIELPIDNKTGKFRGFAYIEYEENDDAKQAIDNYDEAEIFGKIIRVRYAKNSKNRQKAVWDDDTYYLQQQNQLEDQLEEDLVQKEKERQENLENEKQIEIELRKELESELKEN